MAAAAITASADAPRSGPEAVTSGASPDRLFQQAVAIVLRHEGGYVHDPTDPGGETSFGISKRSYPDLDIAALTREQAIAIYRHDWWEPHRYGELPAALACKTFDLAVNLGARTIARLLQQACAACGQVVAVDGAIGDDTIAAVKACDAETLLAALKRAAAAHYEAITVERPELRIYLEGWLARAKE